MPEQARQKKQFLKTQLVAQNFVFIAVGDDRNE